MVKKIGKEEVEEIKEFLTSEGEKRTKDTNIIFDGKQYSIRIPKEFADILEFDKNGYKFEFLLEIPPYTAENNKPKLTGRLIRG